MVEEILGGEIGPIAALVVVANAIATGVVLIPHDWQTIHNSYPTSPTTGFCRWAAEAAGRHLIVAVFGLGISTTVQATAGTGLLFGLGWVTLYSTAIVSSAFAHDHRPVTTVATRVRAWMGGLRSKVGTVTT